MTSLRATFMALAVIAFSAAPFDSGVVAEENFTKEHRQAAFRAMRATQSTKSFDDILPLMAERAKRTFTRSNPALADEIEEVAGLAALKLVERRAELSKIVQDVWARRFTLEELNQITAFYQSPLGKKLAKNSETIAALSFAAAKKWGDEISQSMVEEIRKELKARGHNL